VTEKTGDEWVVIRECNEKKKKRNIIIIMENRRKWKERECNGIA